MKSRILAVVAVASLMVGVAIAKEAKESKEGTAPKADLSDVKCMFSGKACKADATADYKKGKVHFCCNGCVKKFGKDSKKYASKANHHLVATGQFKQKGCPLTGGKAKDSTAIKVAGAKVAFCCGNCKKKAEGKSGDDQIDLVFNDKAFKKGFKVASKK